MKTMGDRIKNLLETKGMTQTALAYATGVSEVTISRYVNNSRSARSHILNRIAEVLGVNIEYLISGSEMEIMNEERKKLGKGVKKLIYLELAEEMENKNISVNLIKKIIEGLEKE